MSSVNTTNFGNLNGDYQVAADILLKTAPKMRANLNGTGTIAIRDSENVSSAVDNGTGSYSFNFTSNFSNANYTATGLGSKTNGSIETAMVSETIIPTSSQFTLTTANNTNVADSLYAMATLSGDLA